ncbi:MAG: helix-turn-helix domain-containing protein [Hyphomicrobium sp.]
MAKQLKATDRLKILLGGYGTGAKVADALGLSREHVSRIFTGKTDQPEYLAAIAELLEALPPKDWPERWRR